jgi:hypothetical protein
LSRHVNKSIDVRVKQPTLVMAAPDNYKAKLWGMYQHPCMWKSNNGDLYVAVNNGEDKDGGMGVQEGSFYFTSKDLAETWDVIEKENQDGWWVDICFRKIKIDCGLLKKGLKE